MDTAQILPVAIIAGVIYLIKIGALSAVAVALGKIWKRITKKNDEYCYELANIPSQKFHIFPFLFAILIAQ